MGDNNPASTVTDNPLAAILLFQQLCESNLGNTNDSLKPTGSVS